MLGRYLRLSTVYLFFSIAAVLCAAAKERPDSTPSVDGTVRFDLYRGYLMVARGSVGPLKGLHFLLDTGTSTTLIDSHIARRLNLNGLPEEVNIMFFNGGVGAMHANVPNIVLGPVRRNHVPVLVEDLSVFEDALPVHIDAVIGLDVLGGSPFQVDFRRSRIFFGHLPRLPISIPLSVEDGLAMVDAEVNHTTAHLLIDTGTPALLIFVARIPKAIAGIKIHKSRSDANARSGAERKEVHLPKFQLGEAEFTRQQAFVMENRDEGGREFDGLLSPAALGIDAFTVDLERGALELRLGM
jgi:predicted aspartyl protease